jgi:hypothetical protein
VHHRVGQRLAHQRRTQLAGLVRGGCAEDELKEPHDAIRSDHLSIMRLRMTTGEKSTSGPVITIDRVAGVKWT